MYAGLVGKLPVLDADAPTVARLQAGKAPLGAGRDKVIAERSLVEEELFVHQNADGMLADIVGAGIAFAVAVETGERVRAAGLQDAA
jgi:hypothetical protein